MNTDAIRFIEQAHRLATDPLGALRGEAYHPLHSLCTLIVHGLFGRLFTDDRDAWLFAVQSVGVLCGAIVAVQILMLARRFGAPFWASLGAALAWIVGRRTSSYGADGLSDMLFLSLFAASLLLAIRASRFRDELSGRQLFEFFAAGFLAGLAYLTRPEGLAALLIVLIFLFVLMIAGRGVRSVHRNLPMRRKLLPKHPQTPRHLLAAMAAMVLGTLLPALPYMFIIGGLTQKKTLSVLAPVPHLHLQAAAALALPEHTSILQKVSMELWETFGFGPWLALFGAMLLAPHLWGRPRLRPLVNIWFFVWAIVMLWLVKHAGYLDGRHTLPLVLLLHGLLALAFVVWMKPMRWWMNWWRAKPDAWARLPLWMRYPGWPYIFAAGAILLTLLPGIIRLSTPPQENLRFMRDAAGWVHANVAPNVVICDHDRLIGYYSGNPFRQWLGTPQQPLLGQVHFSQPHIVGLVFRPGLGEEPQLAIGPYRAIAEFHSSSAAHGDVLLLYALPESPIMIHGQPRFLTELTP
ncbi:MAG: hypothetical protein ACTHN5_22465 [Phycisphaerae bacterium]